MKEARTMTYENLARALNDEKHEALREYRCAKNLCVRPSQLRRV